MPLLNGEVLSYAVDDQGRGAFRRDGQPHQIISGALHYFRVPRPLWRDRLLRLKAMGCTTLETYVAWNFHQTRADQIADFTGDRDLGAYLDLAAELDLDVLVRPGPFICAEWDFGGLPSWLMTDPALTNNLRTSDAAWLDVVDRWFDQLIPVIVPRLVGHGGRVIAVQVENEYGSYGNDTGYLEHLADGLAERGVDVPLFTSDGPSELMLRGGTIDHSLATVNFGSRQAEAFATLRGFRPTTPTMCMEFWNGWFDHWGAPHHTRSAQSAAIELAGMLADGHSVNFYMAHGGTSFGVWSGANAVDTDAGMRLQPTVSSYDYDSPIAEDGTLTAKYDAFRAVIEQHRGEILPEPPAPAARLAPQTVAVVPGPSLASALDAAQFVPTPAPLSMEDLGVHHGVVRYRVPVGAAAEPVTIRLDGLADLARVSVGDQVGLVSDLDLDPRFTPTATMTLAGDTVLDVVVSSLGRINFGPHLARQPKGLRQIRVDYQHQFGIDHAAVDLTELPDLAALADGTGGEPGFYRAEITVDEPADGFLALDGWAHGYLYLNGFNLGRYWSIGPTRTLYAPAPLWRSGVNELVVCELIDPGSTIQLLDVPDLGPVAPDSTTN